MWFERVQSHLHIECVSDCSKFSKGKLENERNFACWGSGHFNRLFNGQSAQLSHQCRCTCVHQFSLLLAVLFFCSCVCNGVNSWTPLLLTLPTHVLSVAPFLFFTVLFSPSLSLFLSWCQVKAACFRSGVSRKVSLKIKQPANPLVFIKAECTLRDLDCCWFLY